MKFREGERERKSVERVLRQAALDKNNCCTQRQDSNSRGHSVSHVPCLLLVHRQVALTSGSSENRTENTQKTIISKRSGWARIISKGKEEEPQSIANGCETDNELKEP